MIRRLLNFLFGQPEEINGGERCGTYLYRWQIFKRLGRGLYLHHFVGDDWSFDLHDHPRSFISIGLVGKYREEMPNGERIYRAPWFRSFPANHIHRISMIDGGQCWTIVVVLKSTRPWGFWHKGQFIGWREYVYTKGGPADERAACK
jgi:hypothetical protein